MMKKSEQLRVEDSKGITITSKSRKILKSVVSRGKTVGLIKANHTCRFCKENA